jgi:hypothetical protein
MITEFSLYYFESKLNKPKEFPLHFSIPNIFWNLNIFYSSWKLLNVSRFRAIYMFPSWYMIRLVLNYFSSPEKNFRKLCDLHCLFILCDIDNIQSISISYSPWYSWLVLEGRLPVGLFV